MCIRDRVKYWWKGTQFHFLRWAGQYQGFGTFLANPCGLLSSVPVGKLWEITDWRLWQIESGDKVGNMFCASCMVAIVFFVNCQIYKTAIFMNLQDNRNHIQTDKVAFLIAWIVLQICRLSWELSKGERREWCWINLEDQSCHSSKRSTIVPTNSLTRTGIC